MKLYKPLLLCSLLFALASCDTPEIALNNLTMKNTCKNEAAAKWLGPVPKIDKMLVLPYAFDPNTHNNMIIPADQSIDDGYGKTDLKSVGKVFKFSFNTGNTFLVNSAIIASPNIKFYTLATHMKWIGNNEYEQQAIPGVYAVEVYPIDSPQCKDPRHWPFYENPPPNVRLTKPIDNVRCMLTRYVGGYDANKFEYIFIGQYGDTSYHEHRKTRILQEIRNNHGKVYARSVRYTFDYYADFMGNTELCKTNYDLYNLLKDTKF